VTDADRLRRAADELDRCMDALESQRMHRGSPLVQEKRATVALLRAVESDVDAPHTRIEDDGSYDLYYCSSCGDIWPCWPSTVHAAAHHLADVILGGER